MDYPNSRPRPFDPTSTEMSLFQPLGTASQSDSTWVAQPKPKGNKLMRWIVRKWLQPSYGQRRNSLIQVSSSENPEFEEDETGMGFETKQFSNEATPVQEDTNIPSPVSLVPTGQSNVSGISDRTRPLSQMSEIVVPVASDESWRRPLSSVVSDSPHSGAGGSNIHVPSTTDSNVSPHRKRRHTKAGREMFHAL
jgi:hypothetical protein